MSGRCRMVMVMLRLWLVARYMYIFQLDNETTSMITFSCPYVDLTIVVLLYIINNALFFGDQW